MAQDTPEKSILEKLAQTQTFHPAGAKLFVPDWTLDPGDVVTVTSKKDVHNPDEEPTEYKVPIYSMDLTWNGTSRLDIQSTGNQEREPLSALRRKEYQTGRRGYGMQKEIEEETQQQYEHYTEQTDAYRKEIYRVNGVVYDSNGNIVYQTDPVTGEYILDNAGNKIPVYNPESNGSISGQVIQSAQRMATIIKQSGTVYEVFSETKQYYEGDRVLYPDSNGNPYKFITDHNPGAWKGTGEHGDVEALGTLQSQIDQNVDYTASIYGTVTDLDTDVKRIEGSTLWQNETNLVNIVGSVTIDKTNNKVVINNGYGLVTNDNGTYHGVWDEGNLTAGAIVTKINDQATGEGATVYRIKADKIILDGTATATTLDARLLNVDNLFSQTGYSESITVGKSVNAANVYADNFYFRQEAGTTPYQMHTRLIYLLGDESYLTDISAVTIGTAETMNLRHSHSISIEAMSGADEGKIQVTLGEAVVTNSTDRIKNFNIADTAFYKKRVGISSVAPGNWQYDSTEHKYYNPVVATAKDSTQTNPDTMTANVFIPDITLTPVVNGLTYVGKVNAWGPSVSGTVYAAADELSLYLKEKDNYVYITKTDSDPVTVGPNSNVVARMEIQGGGSEEDYDMGYADGQTNARAEISGIILNRTYTSYSDNNLSIKISGTPKLVLLSNDDPPVETERFGERLDVDTTMAVRTTNARLSEGAFTNGQYTITGTGGNVNVDSVDGVGGANIPVGVTPLTFTPTGAIRYGTSLVNNGTPVWTGGTGVTINGQTGQNKYQYQLATSGRLNADGESDEDVDYLNPTAAFTHGFNICFNSVTLTAEKTELNAGESVEVIPNMLGTWDATKPQPFSSKKIVISAKTGGTITPLVAKGTWGTGADAGKITFTAGTTGDPTASVNLSVKTPLTHNSYATIGVYDDTSVPTNKTETLYLHVENRYAYILNENTSTVRDNLTTGNVVARVNNTAFAAGQKAVAPTTASISTSTADESTGKRYSTLTVKYKGPDTTEDSLPLENVDVTTIYNAGKAAGTTQTEYPVTFKVTFDDGHTGNVTADCAEIWNQGARESTPTTPKYYIYNSYGNVVFDWVSTSNAYTIRGGLYPRTEVTYVGTSGDYYQISYGGVTGYVPQSLVEYTTTPTSPTNYGSKTGWASYRDLGYEYHGTTNTENVNLRDGAGTWASIILKMPKGAEVWGMWNPSELPPDNMWNSVIYVKARHELYMGDVDWNYISDVETDISGITINWIRHLSDDYSGNIQTTVIPVAGTETGTEEVQKTSQGVGYTAYERYPVSSGSISKFFKTTKVEGGTNYYGRYDLDSAPSSLSQKINFTVSYGDGSPDETFTYEFSSYKKTSSSGYDVGQTVYVYSTDGSPVYVRYQASSPSGIYGQLVPHTPVIVVSGPTNGYYQITYSQVNYNTVTGYIDAQNLKPSAQGDSNYNYTGWLQTTKTVTSVDLKTDQIVHKRSGDYGFNGNISVSVWEKGKSKHTVTSFGGNAGYDATYSAMSNCISTGISTYFNGVYGGYYLSHSKGVCGHSIKHRLRATVHYSDNSSATYNFEIISTPQN